MLNFALSLIPKGDENSPSFYPGLKAPILIRNDSLTSEGLKAPILIRSDSLNSEESKSKIR